MMRHNESSLQATEAQSLGREQKKYPIRTEKIWSEETQNKKREKGSQEYVKKGLKENNGKEEKKNDQSEKNERRS